MYEIIKEGMSVTKHYFCLHKKHTQLKVYWVQCNTFAVEAEVLKSIPWKDNGLAQSYQEAKC